MDDIKLTIKATNQKYEDLKITCQLSWTILDLKIYLCKEYPSKPNISDQRLIYSGHLLKDEQSLRDIIQLSDDHDTYTFHLVCPQRSATDSGPKSTASSSTTQPQLPSDTVNAAAASSSAASAFSPVPPSNSSPSPVDNPIMNQLDVNNSPDMRESYQALMNQYYQYMSYYYMSTPPPAIDYASYCAFANAYMRGMNQNIPGMPTFNPTNITPINPNNNPNGANQNQPNANNRNANNNNNQDGEEVQRDWTEMLYAFSKAMVMLSIMYFYSSFGRLLLLVVIAALLFFYRNGRLGGAPNIANINNNNNNNDQVNAGREQPQMEQPANNNNEANNNENRESDGQDSPDEVDGANSPNAAIPENSRYSGLRLVWVFVSSLFTSLIPDPAPIN